eukprot:m.30897 g.30897  ORF g.30897 m.30897 type:complete len:1360 (+) comp8255_c0_seq1:208-4287(+)
MDNTLLHIVVLLLFMSTVSSQDNTNWDLISSHLEKYWKDDLPPLPKGVMDVSYWTEHTSTGSVFQRVKANLAGNTRMCNETNHSAVWPNDANSAGPLLHCGLIGNECNNHDEEDCKVKDTINSRSNMAAILSKPGTHWTRMSAQPGWIQMRFPVPSGAEGVTFRFEMDNRYAPSARGGNPCARAKSTPGYNCTLCTLGLKGEPWDYSVKAGVFVLWTIPGLGKYIISPEPLDVNAAYANNNLVVRIDSPEELSLHNTSEVVITLLSFNQYPYSGELEDGVAGYTLSNPTKCSTTWTYKSGDSTGGNYVVGIVSAEIISLTRWKRAADPPLERPRLFGSDDTWVSRFVNPFHNASCKQTAPFNPGWGGHEGYPDMKSKFEIRTKGYSSCHTSGNERVAPATIREHRVVKASYGDPDFRSYRGSTPVSNAYSAIHLARRMRHCHKINPSSPNLCQFNKSEVDWLANEIVTREFVSFHPDAVLSYSMAAWGWEQASDGCCGFDLQTPVPLKLYSLLFDNFAVEAEAINATIASQIKEKMLEYINKFIKSFEDGDWNLWNGNNWTPVLSEGAMYWAIAFWYEFPTEAHRVVEIVNDINILHFETFTDDGVYKEGVCQYSYMSIRSLLAISALYTQAFDEPWPTLNATEIINLGNWHLDSFDMNGQAINFGDSHACRGTTVETLYALMAEAINSVEINKVAETIAIDPCLLHTWSSIVYYITARDVWQFWPVLLSQDFDAIMENCSGNANISGHLPLGPDKMALYTGYGMIRSALLQNCTDPLDQARWKCTIDERGPPRLENVALYSQLSLQSRPNSWPHSEVDFASFKWTAYGASLISEYGYGTIATAVNQYDMRRYNQIDNIAPGHNTVVIREAFSDKHGPGVFSQLQGRQGTLHETKGMNVKLSCMHVKGDLVYGSDRADGWLDVMSRWVCSVAVGNYVIIDALAVKANRSSMSLYGSMYGGPDFQEDGVHQSLTIDEYFHSSNGLSGRLINSTDSFVRAEAARWCQHTDVALDNTDPTNSTVLLTSQCSFAINYGPGDALGRISSWSEHGGQFKIDGVVSATDPYDREKLHLNRFRYVSNKKTTSSGDVRAFILTAGRKPKTAPSSWTIPCDNTPSPEFLVCILSCVEKNLYKFEINRSTRAHVTMETAMEAGTCNGEVAGSYILSESTTTSETTASTFTTISTSTTSSSAVTNNSSETCVLCGTTQRGLRLKTSTVRRRSIAVSTPDNSNKSLSSTSSATTISVSSQMNSSSKSSSTTYETDTGSTSSTTSSITNKNFGGSNKSDGNPDAAVIIPVIIVVLLIAVVLGFVLYAKLRNKETETLSTTSKRDENTLIAQNATTIWENKAFVPPPDDQQLEL